jgi:hypothetical protein
MGGAVVTAFDAAWSILKADFYFGGDLKNGDERSREAAFHSRDRNWVPGKWPYTEIRWRDRSRKPEERERGPFPHYYATDDKYVTAVNLAHPLYSWDDAGNRNEELGGRRLSEDEMIQRIIESIMHEEGHEAIQDEFSPRLLGDSENEYGAMLVEGMEHPAIMEELRRRGLL